MFTALKNASKTRNTGGFTLVELLVVIVVIGILAAIAVPVFLNQAEKANLASAQSDVANIAKLVQADYAETGTISAVNGQTYASGNGFGSVVATGTVTITGDASTWCVESDVNGAVASYSAENGAGTGCSIDYFAVLAALLDGDPIYDMMFAPSSTWSEDNPILITFKASYAFRYGYTNLTNMAMFSATQETLTPRADGGYERPIGNDGVETYHRLTADATDPAVSIIPLFP